MMIEMTEIKDPLIQNTDSIYGNSKLKRRLAGEKFNVERVPGTPGTGRSLSSLKSFRP